jgi:hypothetical protein
MSRLLRWPTHDPDEFLDYSIDWSARLGSDTVSTSTWAYSGTPDTTPLILSSPTIDSAGEITTTWIDNGTNGTDYSVVNHVTTAGGRLMDQTVNIRVKAR